MENATAFCTACGAKLEAGQAFCSGCGKAVGAPAAPAEPVAAAPAAAPAKKKKKWLIPAIVAAVVLLVAVVLAGGKGPGKEVKKLVGSWGLYGAFIDDELTYNSNGSFVVNKDGTATLTVGDTSDTFDRFEYVETTDSGAMVFWMYKGSDRLKVAYIVDSNHGEAVMIGLADNFVLVYNR